MATALRLTLLASSAVLLAQAPSPTFHVSTRLIQVNVIVTGKRGEPVTGLNKEQFTLYDRGRQQRIAVFSEHTDRVRATSLPAVTNVFSNRPDEKMGAVGGVTVILFDSLNTKPNDAAFARARVVKFLRSVGPDDRIALYGLSTKLSVLLDFTEDADALVHALDRFKSSDSYEARVTKVEETHTGNPSMDVAQNDINQRVLDAYMGTRVQTTAAALEAVANHLAGVSGRKTLVWVSGSFPIDTGYFQKRMRGTSPQRATFQKEVESAARALSNANVAIYPVAAQGLQPLESFSTGPNMRRPSYVELQVGRLAPDLAPIADWRTMDLLADITGGRVYRETNDIEGAVRHAIEDSRSTYVLGFYPDHDQWDGDFHEIKIQVKHPGVDVRYRRGYVAFPESPAEQNRQPLQVSDIINTALDSAELGLTMQVDPMRGAVGRQARIHLRVDIAGMTFEQKDGRWTDALDVMWVQLGADGNAVASHGQSLRLRLSQETYRNAGRDGVRMSSVETIQDQAVELRFAARDRGTGAAGSLRIPLRRLF